jgi:hypothetical protein
MELTSARGESGQERAFVSFASALRNGECVHCHDREENEMATKRPSFLKRQKEQKRHARAAEKREARKERKQAKTSGVELPEAEPDVQDAENTENTATDPQ